MNPKTTGRLICVLAIGLLMFGAVPASAASGPTQAQKGLGLAEPAVVFITTSFTESVRLRYQSSSTISGVRQVKKTYSFPQFQSGSGFIVNPTGTIVTAS